MMSVRAWRVVFWLYVIAALIMAIGWAIIIWKRLHERGRSWPLYDLPPVRQVENSGIGGGID